MALDRAHGDRVLDDEDLPRLHRLGLDRGGTGRLPPVEAAGALHHPREQVEDVDDQRDATVVKQGQAGDVVHLAQTLIEGPADHVLLVEHLVDEQPLATITVAEDQQVPAADLIVQRRQAQELVELLEHEHLVIEMHGEPALYLAQPHRR